jgi:nucleotide-binding universal stress UspA family protein
MWIDRVAVEVDASDEARRAAEWAARHLAPRSEVVLVHATPEDDSPPAWIRAMVEERGARVRVVNRRGDPAEELGAAAFREGADLAVVPASLRGSAERAELASPVPVIVTSPDPGGRLRRAVVLMDPTPATDAALQWATLLRDGVGVQVIPCAVIERWGDEGIRRAAWRSLWGGDPAAEERSATLRWARRTLARSPLASARDEVRVGIGGAAEVLARTAESTDAGLIVLATDGSDPFGRALRRDVLRRATVPVLLADPAHERPTPRRARPRGPDAASPLLTGRGHGDALTR